MNHAPRPLAVRRFRAGLALAVPILAVVVAAVASWPESPRAAGAEPAAPAPVSGVRALTLPLAAQPDGPRAAPQRVFSLTSGPIIPITWPEKRSWETRDYRVQYKVEWLGRGTTSYAFRIRSVKYKKPDLVHPIDQLQYYVKCSGFHYRTLRTGNEFPVRLEVTLERYGGVGTGNGSFDLTFTGGLQIIGTVPPPRKGFPPPTGVTVGAAKKTATLDMRFRVVDQGAHKQWLSFRFVNFGDLTHCDWTPR